LKPPPVFAVTLSERAKVALEQSSIHLEWDYLVSGILDSDRCDISCPFEKLAVGISNPEEAYAKLKAVGDLVKAGRGKSV